MRYLIALGGDFYQEKAGFFDWHKDYTFVWAIDRGLEHLRQLGIMPQRVLGDMDSVSPATLTAFESELHIVRFPRSKDFTDGATAFDQLKPLLKPGDEVHILGAMGNDRLDHQANVLAMAEQLRVLDVDVLLTDGRTWQYLLRPNHVYTWQFAQAHTLPTIISLLAVHSVAAGIETRGLAYPLHNESLGPEESRGLSNLPEENCQEICVSYRQGFLNLYFLYVKEESVAPDATYYQNARI